MQTVAHDKPFAAVPALQQARRTESWIGRALSGLAVLFLVFDGVGKVLELQPVIDGTMQLGYPRDVVFGLGAILLAAVLVYVIPATTVLGAVLLTGYLGGAVAAQVRVGNPLFTHVLFPVYVAAFLWGGLLLRDAQLRAVLLWRARDGRGSSAERRPS